jgi:Mrp family chromosome partitioning ATPase
MQPVSKHAAISSRPDTSEGRGDADDPRGRPVRDTASEERFDGRAHPRESSSGSRVHRLESGSEGASMAVPAREVTFDARRVDPSVATLSESTPRIAEQFDKLAVSLVMAAQQQPIKRILVASPNAGDGRTSAVINLATALAYAKQRVLVVDCDLRSPSVLRLLGIDAEIGLVETIARDLPMMSALINVHPARYHVLPTREPVANPTGVLVAPALREVLTTLDHFYDFILFDAPPLTDPGSHVIVGMTDTTVLVIRAGVTTSAQLAKAIEPLKEENLFGVVLNRASL